jgi:hypothetical protein
MTKNPAQIIWQEMESKVTKLAFRTPRAAIGLLVVLALMLGTSPATARDKPKRSGPLNQDDPRACGRDTLKKWINGRREVVAKAETCLYVFNYDPQREDNENRDYGIAWIQARVEPRGAWCAKRVWSDLVVSEDTKIHKRAPAKNFKIGKSRKVEVKLTSFANGASDEKATVSEKTTIHPRRLRHSSFRFKGQPVFRQRWTGQRGRPVNLTSGAEVSWEHDDPPDAISSSLLYDFERRGRC